MCNAYYAALVRLNTPNMSIKRSTVDALLVAMSLVKSMFIK
jgi:hypothetical protein